MTKAERRFVIFTTVYAAVFCQIFMLSVYLSVCDYLDVNVGLFLVPLGGLLIALSFGVVYIAIRDLLKRPFADKAYTRAFWLSIIIGTSGMGAFVYAFKCGFKPWFAQTNGIAR